MKNRLRNSGKSKTGKTSKTLFDIKQYTMKIREINEAERPRERLLAKGAEALGTAELLAILIRTGSGKRNAIELAYEIIASAGSLTGLSAMSSDRLTAIPGIGKEKAAVISAAIELGRRFSAESSTAAEASITSPEQVYGLMSPFLKGIDHEECWVLYLNRANHIIFREKISSGGLNSTTIDANTILRKAIEKKADGLILVHNHPSGNPHPGDADIRETARLKKAADTFRISLMDHIIISDGCFYSFSDEQMSPGPTERFRQAHR